MHIYVAVSLDTVEISLNATDAGVRLYFDRLEEAVEKNEPMVIGEGVANSYEEALRLLWYVFNGRIDFEDDKPVITFRGIRVWIDPRPKEGSDAEFEVWAIPLE